MPQFTGRTSIIGHELGHDEIKEYLGSALATKGDEAGADIIAVRSLIESCLGPDEKYNPNLGYRADAGILFLRRLQKEIDAKGKKDVLGKIYQALYDPHPLEGNRIIGMELALSNESIFKRGELTLGEYKPIPDVLKLNTSSSKHETYFDRWRATSDKKAPTERLQQIFEGLEKSSPKKFSYEEDNRAVFSLRVNEAIKLIKELKTDGSPEYLIAADKFASWAAKIDPYNEKGYFDRLYSAISENLSELNQNKKTSAIGRFKNLHDALKDIYALAPADGEQITLASERLDGTLLNAISYFFPTSSLDGDYREKRPRRSYVIRSTEISNYIQAAKLKELYILANNPYAAKVIWRLGGGYDENFWELIGPEKVKEFSGTAPLFNGELDDGTKESTYKSYALNKSKIDSWIRAKSKKDLGEKMPESISAYVEYYKDDLFPLGKQVPQQDIRDGHHPAAEKFKTFVISKFKNATEEDRKLYLQELRKFYGSCMTWRLKLKDLTSRSTNGGMIIRGFNALSIGSFGKKEADLISLSENHPYVQLLLADELNLDVRFKVKGIGNTGLDGKFSPETARQIYEYLPQGSVPDCISFHSQLSSLDGSRDLLSKILRTEIALCLQTKNEIKVNDPDLLALSKITPDNTNHYKDHKYLLSQAVVGVLSEKLWKTQQENIGDLLKDHTTDEVMQLYRFMERNNLYPTSHERALLGNVLLERIKQAPKEDRLALCEKTLLRTKPPSGFYGAEDPYVTNNLSLRDSVCGIWQIALMEKYGLDDGSPNYKRLVTGKIRQILSQASSRDKTILLETLADGLLIQSGLAKEIRDGLQTTREQLTALHMPIAGGEALFSALENDDKLRLSCIDYFSEPLSQQSLATVSSAVKKNRYVTNRLCQSNRSASEGIILNDRQENILKNSLQDLHNYFSHLTVEQRSAILSVLLVPEGDRIDEQKYFNRYQEALQLVMAKAFPDKSEDTKTANSFINAYLNTAADHERTAFLGGMLSVAIDRDPEKPASMAEQTAKIMAALGPAYVKLGQAINSHPQTPDDWRAATSGLKSAAKTDPRWDLIKQIEDNLPADIKKDDLQYGPLLGSASFNTAMKITYNLHGNAEGVVALIERPNAATKAEGGFHHLKKTVMAWDSQVIQSHKDTILEMIQEAREISTEETSKTVNDIQCDLSEKIYAGKQIIVKDGSINTIVNLNPVKSLFSTDGLRFLSLAEGCHFSDLPEATPEQKALKKTIAKAYVAFEMSNLLSGSPFDCDRHGKQLKVDFQSGGQVNLNIYDFGGLSITPPTEKQKTALGKAINVIASKGQKNAESAITDIIKNTADLEERAFLMRTRKAWLALSDFTRHFDDEGDYREVLLSVVNTKIDPTIKQNIPMLPMLNFASKFGNIPTKTKSTIIFGEAPFNKEGAFGKPREKNVQESNSENKASFGEALIKSIRPNIWPFGNNNNKLTAN